MSHNNERLTSEPLPLLGNSSSQTVGWKRLKFGDVCKVQGGFAFKSKEYQKSGIPLVRISNLVNGKVSFESDTVYLPASKLDVHKDFILKRGDTLIAMSGATTGKMATFDMDSPALLNQRVGRFRILSANACNSRFISLLVQQITRQVLKEAYGAAQPNISPSQIEQIPIPFPPIEEQNAIVAEIEKQFTRLDAGVAGLRRVRANLKRYRAAVLKAACEGKIVPTEAELARQEGRSYETGAQLLERILTERRRQWKGKGKYKDPAKPDLANLQPLPEGWDWATIDLLLREPLRNGHSAKATGTGKGLRAFTLSAVTEGDFSEQNTKLTVADAAKVTELWAEPGDIYIERSNTPELVGIARLYRGPKNFAFIPDLLIRVRLLPMVSDRFVEICLLSSAGRDYFRMRAQGISGSMPKIDQSTIETAPISVPPIAEQERIVAEVECRLSVVEELESVINADFRRAGRLREAILFQSFSRGLSPEALSQSHRRIV